MSLEDGGLQMVLPCMGLAGCAADVPSADVPLQGTLVENPVYSDLNPMLAPLWVVTARRCPPLMAPAPAPHGPVVRPSAPVRPCTPMALR